MSRAEEEQPNSSKRKCSEPKPPAYSVSTDGPKSNVRPAPPPLRPVKKPKNPTNGEVSGFDRKSTEVDASIVQEQLETIYRESLDEDWIYDGEDEVYTSSFDWETAKPKIVALVRNAQSRAAQAARIDELRRVLDNIHQGTLEPAVRDRLAALTQEPTP